MTHYFFPLPMIIFHFHLKINTIFFYVYNLFSVLHHKSSQKDLQSSLWRKEKKITSNDSRHKIWSSNSSLAFFTAQNGRTENKKKLFLKLWMISFFLSLCEVKKVLFCLYSFYLKSRLIFLFFFWNFSPQYLQINTINCLFRR